VDGGADTGEPEVASGAEADGAEVAGAEEVAGVGSRPDLGYRAPWEGVGRKRRRGRRSRGGAAGQAPAGGLRRPPAGGGTQLAAGPRGCPRRHPKGPIPFASKSVGKKQMKR
jgi:hypothetical protein